MFAKKKKNHKTKELVIPSVEFFLSFPDSTHLSLFCTGCYFSNLLLKALPSNLAK